MGNFKDLTGQRFGRLEVISLGDNHIAPNGKKSRQWWCLCDCQRSLPENERKLKLILERSLLRGDTASCGCNKGSPDNLVGQKFGCFTVIERTERPENSFAGAYWLCQCKCGEMKIYRTSELKQCAPSSCGKCSKNTFDLSGEYGIGYTSNGEEFFFDLEDYPIINKYTWHLDPSGYIHSREKSRGKRIRMHRLVMGIHGNNESIVDHKNHIRHDNRKENLRICTYSENAKNIKTKKNNTSGVIGVHASMTKGKWIAAITCDKKRKYLGTFDSFEEAIKARKEAERIYFKDFSYENSVGG